VKQLKIKIFTNIENLNLNLFYYLLGYRFLIN
jgi:hypothetical protein